jgi:hypothetical protein
VHPRRRVSLDVSKHLQIVSYEIQPLQLATGSSPEDKNDKPRTAAGVPYACKSYDSAIKYQKEEAESIKAPRLGQTSRFESPRWIRSSSQINLCASKHKGKEA